MKDSKTKVEESIRLAYTGLRGGTGQCQKSDKLKQVGKRTFSFSQLQVVKRGV